MAPLPLRPLLALVAVFATLQMSQGFQLMPGTNNALVRRNNECITRRSVTSQDTTDTTTQKIPYSISRGDGSTGGGGRPMPNQNAAAELSTVEQDDEELKRPKVGAEMPHGRPSWFRVPAPSQGTSISVSDMIPRLFVLPLYTYRMRLYYNIYSHNLVLFIYSC
jgi:hypothetical protein